MQHVQLEGSATEITDENESASAVIDVSTDSIEMRPCGNVSVCQSY